MSGFDPFSALAGLGDNYHGIVVIESLVKPQAVKVDQVGNFVSHEVQPVLQAARHVEY